MHSESSAEQAGHSSACASEHFYSCTSSGITRNLKVCMKMWSKIKQKKNVPPSIPSPCSHCCRCRAPCSWNAACTWKCLKARASQPVPHAVPLLLQKASCIKKPTNYYKLVSSSHLRQHRPTFLHANVVILARRHAVRTTHWNLCKTPSVLCSLVLLNMQKGNVLLAWIMIRFACKPLVGIITEW